MTKKKIIQIDFSPAQVLTSLYGTRSYNEKTAKEVEQAVFDVLSLIEPAIIYQWADEIRVKDSKVWFLYNNKKVLFHPGCSAGILEPAQKGIIAVWTIGSKITEKIEEFNRIGDAFKAWVYDAAGLVALDKTYQAIKDMAVREAQKEGWGVSPLLSPGSVDGWPLEEQKVICDVLETEKSGIKLTLASVLVPFKSASGLLGIGPGYDKDHQGSMCLLCARNQNCPNKPDK